MPAAATRFFSGAVGLHLVRALLALTGMAGGYLFMKLTAPKERKIETCFLAPNLNSQLHVLKKVTCSEKYCSMESLNWMVAQIDSATKRLDVMMYFLTYPVFTTALIRAKDRGVLVRCILQFDKNDEGSEWVRLRRAHIAVRMMNVPGCQLMHMKLIIIDRTSIVFGSMNLTFSGLTENHEEILRTDDSESVYDCIEYFNMNWKLVDNNDQFDSDCRKIADSKNRDVLSQLIY